MPKGDHGARAKLAIAALVSSACLGCGDDGGAADASARDAGAPDPEIVDAGASDADRADGNARDAATDGGEVTTIEVDVVELVLRALVYAPLASAHVRVDGADGSTAEALTDAMGHASVEVPADSGPWTVTAARVGYTVVSVLGVDGPIAGALHLSPTTAAPTPDTRTVSGAVSGRGAGAFVQAQAPGLISQSFAADSYTMELVERPGVLRVWVSELDVAGTLPPANAAWLDVDFGAPVSSGLDIALPSPSRSTARSAMSLRVPTTGAVDASTFTLSTTGASAAIVQDSMRYPVGSVALGAPTAGVFPLDIEALEGDMAPTHVLVDLVDGGEWRLSASAPFAPDATFEVPGATALSVAGTTLGDARITIDVAADVQANASFFGAGPTWFVYAYAPGPLVDVPWPELPSGLPYRSLTSVDVPDGGRMATIAAVVVDGVRPWELSRLATVGVLAQTLPVSRVGR